MEPTEGTGTQNAGQHLDVLIIGGGMGGISTAYHLTSDAWFKGTIGILEARPRLGGRIVGHQLASKYVELGANWIHGIIGNPIYDIAVKHKLVDPLGAEIHGLDEVRTNRYQVMGFTQTGEKVPLNLVEETYTTYFWFMKQCETYYSLQGSCPSFGNSVGKHLKADIEGYLRSSKIKDKESIPTRRAIFDNLLTREACISGSHSIDDVSLKDFGSYQELPGGNLVMAGGYVQVLNALLDSIDYNVDRKKGSRFDVFMEHQVVDIKWKEDSEEATVVCSNGKTFTCNHVVVTLPLGVLKETASQLFHPPLPQYKLDCIQMLGFNVVDKIFLEYRQKLCPQFLEPLINEILLFWVKDQEEAERKWYQKIYSFARVSDHCLLGWVCGDEAALVEQMDPKEVGRQITEHVLRPFLGNPDFPEPDNVMVTKWKEDQFTRGSYTYITSNCSIREIELMSQPIYRDPAQDKPILVFAGEACHPSYYSTTHGAFLSGRKAASYLLDPDSTPDSSQNSSNLGNGCFSQMK